MVRSRKWKAEYQEEGRGGSYEKSFGTRFRRRTSIETDREGKK